MNSPAQPFRLLLRVRYAECDQQGIVFNARYADYVDLLMSELVRAAFGSYRAMLDAHLDTHVVRYAIEWSAPARFDDVLSLTITALELGNTSFTTSIEIRGAPAGPALARVEVVNVLVDSRDGAKTRIPDWCRDRLLAAAAAGTVDFSGGSPPAPVSSSPRADHPDHSIARRKP
jgi:acyl-CoA thioester hydrolase